MVLDIALGQTRGDLSEMLEPGRAFGQVPLQPAHRSLLLLRGSALRIEMNELQGVFERELRHLAGSVLGRPKCPPLDRTAEAGVGMTLRGHERMFPRRAVAF